MDEIWSAVICCPGTGIGIDMVAAKGKKRGTGNITLTDYKEEQVGYVARVEGCGGESQKANLLHIDFTMPHLASVISPASEK
jgi:hypothetical protein